VRFHGIQNGEALLGNAPAAIQPLDEALAKNVQVGSAGSQPFGAFSPVATAGRKKRHIPPEVRDRRETLRITDEYLENRHLEVH
jgi:hypothetical protein